MGSNPSGSKGADGSSGRRARHERELAARAERDEAVADDRPKRCGTVEAVRHVKDDGRALILYVHADRASSATREAEPTA